jgi:hypothetical protein
MPDRSSLASSPPGEEAPLRRRRWRLLAIAGGIGLALAAVLGVAAFALSGGFDKKVSERVSGTETQVVRVALVDAVIGFDVTPDVLEVDRGTHVVLNVVNEGYEDHDLAVDGGPKDEDAQSGRVPAPRARDGHRRLGRLVHPSRSQGGGHDA